MGRTISGAGARKVQVARSDAGVDIWRRSIDHHNKWKAENPRPSHCRASVAKQAPAPTLMGILLAAMLAGAHVAEARISIASSPRRIANRQAKDPASQPSEGTNVRSATVLRTDQSLATAVMPAGKVTMSELAADALSEAASPTRLNRKTRNTPEDDAQPKVQGDLSLDRKSLIGARVLATSVLLGSAAENKDYKQILEIANAIHRRASDEPDNKEAAEASAMLFREEGLTWARENGADIMGVSDEKALKVFQETWDRVLNPPPPP